MVMKLKTPDGFTLDAEYKKVGKDKCVIYAHGMTVDKDDEGIFVRSETFLNEKGYSTIRFDFRAHGKSSGDSVKDVTISGELKDLDTVFSFIKEKGYSWIGLAGASFGGGISALYAGEHPQSIQKLFLANPVLDYEKCFLNPTTPWAKDYFKNSIERYVQNGFIEIGSRKFKVGKGLFEQMTNYFPCTSLKKYNNPLLIVHGDQDSKVSHQDVKDCFSKIKNPHKQLVIIKGSEHGFHEEPYETEVTEMIFKFFTEKNKQVED